MNSELQAGIEYMERERKLKREDMIRMIEQALQVAGRKSVGGARDLRVEMDRKTLEIKVLSTLVVTDFVRNRREEISLEEADRFYPLPNGQKHKVGDLVVKEVTPQNFGRIAAQTAKQVIMQALREAERGHVQAEFKELEGKIVTGTIRRFDRMDVAVDLGAAEGVMPKRERVANEDYQIGDRIRFLLQKIDVSPGGTQLILSRANPEFIRQLFEVEVAEIGDGTVQIKAIARDAGYRTKLAVASRDEKVDPVGACVGLRGQRVKNIVRELSGEKVDIVKWSDDIKIFVANALAPARLNRVEVDEDTHTVRVRVDADQQSLAIGKKGQNVKLTARLTGWRIDVKPDEELSAEQLMAQAVAAMAAVKGIGEEAAKELVAGGFTSLEGIVEQSAEDVAEATGWAPEKAEAVYAAAAAACGKSTGGEEEA